jgi:hypothetical protein
MKSAAEPVTSGSLVAMECGGGNRQATYPAGRLSSIMEAIPNRRCE